MRIRTRARTALLVGVLLTVSTAGCGDDSGNDGVATVGGKGKTTSSPSAQVKGDPVKFAQCMRKHGIDMPDPDTSGGGITINIPKGTDRRKVDAAQKACKQFMPGGGTPPKLDAQALAQLRKLAKCMREHGVPKFPDPKPNGGIGIDGRSGLDPNSPKFKAAEKACAQYQPKGARPGGGPQTSTRTGDDS
jgi:hypothetical protein